MDNERADELTVEIMVCSACGTKACADGDLMCEESRSASIVVRREPLDVRAFWAVALNEHRAPAARLVTLVCQCGHPETGTSDHDAGRKMHAHQVEAAIKSGGSS